MATSETIMIGDTMETDILGGVQMGYRTILVLTGSTKREDLADVRLSARHCRRFDRRSLRPRQAASRNPAHDEPRRRHAARHARVGGGSFVIGGTPTLAATRRLGASESACEAHATHANLHSLQLQAKRRSMPKHKTAPALESLALPPVAPSIGRH